MDRPAPDLFHPWIHEARRRLLRERLPWRWLAAAALVVALVMTAGVGRALRDGLAASPWVLPALGALASYRLVRARVLALHRQWRYGWCAALPVTRGAVRRTVLLLSVAMACAIWLPLHLLQAWLGDTTPPAASAWTAAAVWIGAMGGLLSASRTPSLQQERVPAAGRREPLWSARLLHDPHLPWLALWQRRQTTAQWRRSGSAWPLALALCLFPSGGAPAGLLALLVIALTLGWLGLALRCSARVGVQALALLQAQPLTRGRAVRALCRYPLAALLLAAPPGLLLACAGMGVVGAMLWSVVLLALIAPALPALARLRLTQSHLPTRARAR